MMKLSACNLILFFVSLAPDAMIDIEIGLFKICIFLFL